VNAWRELLGQCERKPTRRRVHALRVVTLRIQAELEHDISELPHASHQARAILRFDKLADKLRQTLGRVRELDVWIGKLGRLRTSLGETAAYVPRSTHACIHQIDRLEERLRNRRSFAGQKLTAQIAKRRRDFLALGDEIDQLGSDRLHGTDTSEAHVILKNFGAVIAEFPGFDENNLHEFRKRIKKVRYLVEIHQDGDPACGRMAAQMKKLQSAIGEWHDWQVLARTARRSRHAEDMELGELLDTLAAESYEAAIDACHNIIARMVKLHAGVVQASDGSRPKPPLRSDGSPAPPLRKLA
jgi:CHAD domain-containing protein